MEKYDTDIERLLIRELREKGIKDEIMPRIMKDLSYSFQTDPTATLSDINDRLHSLGWDDVELDYHILQLALASFERGQSRLFP